MFWPPCLDRLSNKFAFHSNIRCQPAIIFYEFIGFHEIIHWMEIAWTCLLWIFFLEWFWMSLSTREKISPAKPTALLKCGGLDKNMQAIDALETSTAPDALFLLFRKQQLWFPFVFDLPAAMFIFVSLLVIENEVFYDGGGGRCLFIYYHFSLCL